MQAEPQVVREGWLVKAPSPKHTWKFWDSQWKKRYFVLCSGHLPGESRLLWYNDDHQRRQHSKAKGSINLEHCAQVDSNLSLSYERRSKRFSYSWIFDLRVSTPKGGSVLYYFSAPSERDMNDWVQILCRLCNLEREDDSDVSGGNERFSAVAAAGTSAGGINQRGLREQMPSDNGPTDHRYVEQPRAHVQTHVTTWKPQQNQHSLSSAGRPGVPPPTQLNVVPPPAFVSRPPVPLPDLTNPESASQPTEEPATQSRVGNKNEGYIPLKDCTSYPTEPIDGTVDSMVRTRLDDTDLPSVTIPDFVNADQPPNYPPPPLPTENGAFQYLPPPHHSRSPSKDSSASSVHLSSTESEQGENRRPSVGNPITPCGPGPGLTLAETMPLPIASYGQSSNPASPISPPAPVTYSRPPRSSEGSSVIDDPLSVTTPPPRPPKNSRSSTSSQTKQPFSYENEPPTPANNADPAKFASYDKITIRAGVINFDSLPRTTKQFAGASGRINSPNAFSTLPKYATFGENSERDMVVDGSISASPKSYGPDSVIDQHRSQMAAARSLHDVADHSSRSRTISSSSAITDADSSYSPFTPGPPRPIPAFVHPDRSQSSETDGNGDQYQNFVHPPRMVNGGQTTISHGHGHAAVHERPPEVKRELKPPRSRAPTLPNGSSSGIGQLPKMPTRLPDVKKHSLPNTGTNGNGNGQSQFYCNNGTDKNEPHAPQFDIERRISFKSRGNLGRQQTAPALIAAPGSAVTRTGTPLDAEVKIEEEAPLDYVAIDATSSVTQPGTPTPTPRRMTQGSASHSPALGASSEHTSTLRVGLAPAPGYVQIDAQATGALRKAQADMTAMRQNQRTLEKNRGQPALNGTGMMSRKK